MKRKPQVGNRPAGGTIANPMTKQRNRQNADPSSEGACCKAPVLPAGICESVRKRHNRTSARRQRALEQLGPQWVLQLLLHAPEHHVDPCTCCVRPPGSVRRRRDKMVAPTMPMGPPKTNSGNPRGDSMMRVSGEIALCLCSRREEAKAHRHTRETRHLAAALAVSDPATKPTLRGKPRMAALRRLRCRRRRLPTHARRPAKWPCWTRRDGAPPRRPPPAARRRHRATST